MDVKKSEKTCASDEFPFKAYPFSDLKGFAQGCSAKKLLFTGINRKKTIPESFLK